MTMMNDFVKGFIQGAKETPRGFFAPLIVLVRLMVKITDSVVKPQNGRPAH